MPSPEHPAIEPFAAAYACRCEAVLRAGAGIIGTVATNAPIELILAAGLVPRRLFPDPSAPTPLADALMEPVFDGAIRSLFDRLLAGHFGALGWVVLPRPSEGHLQLYYFAQEAQRLDADLQLPQLHLVDTLQSPNWATGRYVLAQLDLLKSRLEAHIGAPLDKAALRGAIRVVNRQRQRFAEVNALRRLKRPRLSGTQMLMIAAAAGVIDPRAHIVAMERLLAASLALPEQAGVRLMVKGSAQDDEGFYTLIESCGAVVVADDHMNGERAFEGLVDETAEPMEALARKYHRDCAVPRALPQSRQDERFMQIAGEASVQGVVFVFEEHDDTLGWDYPAQKRMLDAKGIASLCLLHQPYRDPDRAAQRALIAPWVARLSEGQTT